MTEPFTALGIDIGGTKVAAGVVNFPEGRIFAQRRAVERSIGAAGRVRFEFNNGSRLGVFNGGPNHAGRSLPG